MAKADKKEYLIMLDALIKSIETDTPLPTTQPLTRKTMFDAHKRKFKKYPVITGRHWNEDTGYHSEKVWEAIKSGTPYVEANPEDGEVF